MPDPRWIEPPAHVPESNGERVAWRSGVIFAGDGKTREQVRQILAVGWRRDRSAAAVRWYKRVLEGFDAVKALRADTRV